MKVMIIDDSRTIRRLLASYIAPYTNDIVEAEDGAQGLEMLQAGPPVDLVMVDWDMPRMNGLDFVKSVRAQPSYGDLKLLMVTSHNTMEDVGQALEAGATDFLMKPMTEEMVSDKLRMLGVIN